jgi:prevent-host-death family protein
VKFVSIREAKNKLLELGRRAEAGERIIVTRHGKPAFELNPVRKTKGIDWEAGERWLRSQGITRKQGWIAPDFDDPLPEDFLITPITYPDET